MDRLCPGQTRCRARSRETRRVLDRRSCHRKARDRTRCAGLRGIRDQPGLNPPPPAAARTDAGRTAVPTAGHRRTRRAADTAGCRAAGPHSLAGQTTGAGRTAGLRGLPLPGRLPARRRQDCHSPDRGSRVPSTGRGQRRRAPPGDDSPLRPRGVPRGKRRLLAGMRHWRPRVRPPSRDEVRRPDGRAPPGRCRSLARRRRRPPVAQAGPPKTFPRNDGRQPRDRRHPALCNRVPATASPSTASRTGPARPAPRPWP